MQVCKHVHRLSDLESVVHRQGPSGSRGKAGAEGTGAGSHWDSGPCPEFPLSESTAERNQVGARNSSAKEKKNFLLLPIHSKKR